MFVIFQDSAADGARGLIVGDKVTALNQCMVRNVKDWSQCIGREMSEGPTGYCISSDELRKQNIALDGKK